VSSGQIHIDLERHVPRHFVLQSIDPVLLLSVQYVNRLMPVEELGAVDECPSQVDESFALGCAGIRGFRSSGSGSRPFRLDV
jgi:hypothetical protein